MNDRTAFNQLILGAARASGVDVDAVITRSGSDDDPSLTIAGGAFLFDEVEDVDPRWGTGANVLWARGESAMLVGGPGVGKTTLAVQVAAALVGLRQEVLGLPVKPASRVLYLAMDRPRQIRRAMRRLLRPDDRAVLDERLWVRKGPLPRDLARDPQLLVDLARRFSADVIIVDSLKDAVIKLSDDESAGNYNRSIQHCNAADIDVLVLHHQRKPQQGGSPPKSLSDVYGSTWLTAGTGSVVLLHGQAGDDLVELIHLKQPMDPVGPFKLEHDHVAGTTSIVGGFNLWTFLQAAGSDGATVSDALRAEHGSDVEARSAAGKRTERKLKRFVTDGIASREDLGRDSGGRSLGARYRALIPLGEPETQPETHPWETLPGDTPETAGDT